MFPLRSPKTKIDELSERQRALIDEAYARYCELVKNPKTMEEITADGGWSLKTVEAFCWQILAPLDSVARILAHLEAEGGSYEYDKGVLNGLRLAMGVFTKERPDLSEAPRAKAAAEAPVEKAEPVKQTEPVEETESEPTEKAPVEEKKNKAKSKN